MHRTELRVHGPTVDELPAALYESLLAERKGSVERYAGDGFEVVVVERYYLRNNSDQQATVILESVEEDACAVTVVSGGGGAGLLGLSMGSESKQARAIASEIEAICDAKGLRVEAA